MPLEAALRVRRGRYSFGGSTPLQVRRTEAKDAARPQLRFVTPSTEPETVPAPSEQHDLSRGRYLAGLAGILGLAFLLRLSLIMRSDFPLNDGGLFYQMVQDLKANGYAIPAFTSFNDAGIPFGYPPLTLYLAAALTDVTSMSEISAFRWFPLIGSTLIVIAFVPFAASMLKSRVAILAAVLIFAMLGPTFMWMVMGGGLTRSFGFAFAIATIWQAHVMYERRTVWRAPLVAVLAACTIASHLEMGWLAAFSCALFFVAEGRHRQGVISTAVVIALVPVLTAPWWATVIGEHGLEPFRAALESGSNPFVGPLLLLQYDIAVEPLFAIVGALGLLGIVTSLSRRQYLLPAWVLAVALLDPRAFPTSSSIALALLAAIGLTDALLFLSSHVTGPNSARAKAATSSPPALAGAVGFVVVVYVILSAFLVTPKLLTGLTPDERAAMAWVAANTPEDSSLAIITQDGWAVDRTSEWLPVLTGRESSATVQGSEWITGRYHAAQAEYDSLQDCALENGDCLLAWSRLTGREFQYVYIASLVPRVPPEADAICCTSLWLALKTDPRFVNVYEGPGATIYRVVPQPEVRSAR